MYAPERKIRKKRRKQMDVWTYRPEDNSRIGYPKVMTNSKGAPWYVPIL